VILSDALSVVEEEKLLRQGKAFEIRRSHEFALAPVVGKRAPLDFLR